MPRPSPALIPVDQTILGATVNNPAGEKLGTVEDLMINSTDGHIIYAVMSFGGLLGLGKQYHPVPWELLRSQRPQQSSGSRSGQDAAGEFAQLWGG